MTKEQRAMAKALVAIFDETVSLYQDQTHIESIRRRFRQFSAASGMCHLLRALVDGSDNAGPFAVDCMDGTLRALRVNDVGEVVLDLPRVETETKGA